MASLSRHPSPFLCRGIYRAATTFGSAVCACVGTLCLSYFETTAKTVAVTGEERTRNMHTDPRPRRLVPIDDSLAELGGIGRTTLYELVKQGRLTKVNIGRRGFITAESLAAYVDHLTAAAVGGAA